MLLQEEDVAMTVENKVDPAREIAIPDWALWARRHGESGNRAPQPRHAEESESKLIFPSLSAPTSWPRIFPGL
jgi:hypothetical protein